MHGNAALFSHTGSFNLSVCGLSTPAISINSPSTDQSTDLGKSKYKVGTIAGGAIGAVVLVVITIALVCFYLLCAKKFSSRTLETASSEPSTHGKSSMQAHMKS